MESEADESKGNAGLPVGSSPTGGFGPSLCKLEGKSASDPS
uniref:Uncharacterized protein n=1 Tax=Lotus japonicus TaxID=34305 RepID=I3T6D7_LOTJA|nr:unknown [Lotus japonicus]